jgi:hypothetical protein
MRGCPLCKSWRGRHQGRAGGGTRSIWVRVPPRRYGEGKALAGESVQRLSNRGRCYRDGPDRTPWSRNLIKPHAPWKATDTTGESALRTRLPASR